MAAVGFGRAAGWDRLTAEQIDLINNKFVPYAPRWGSTGYATQDAWIREVTRKSWVGTPVNRIAGTYWSIVTASGEPVPCKTLADVLMAFKHLPEKERQAVIEDRGPYNPHLDYYADQPPPPRGMFIKVYCRVLEPVAESQFKSAHRVDLTEFGGRPNGNSMPSHIYEPQREWLWLTEAEAKSLAPGDRQKGETYPIPAAIRQRIMLFYLYNWYTNSGGGFWGPRLLKNGELTLTVEERTASAVRLRLNGAALFDGLVGKGTPPHGGHMFAPTPAESGQKGVPDPYKISYDAKLYGMVEYDLTKKKFTRFDAVALGDYRGHWGISLKVQPVPVGFAFQLDPRDLPPEGRHAPFVLSAVKDYYWAADKWPGRQ
jgi:hypothetical protein